MTKQSTVPVTVLHVQRKAGLFHGVAGWLRPDVEAKDLTHHLDAIRSAAKESGSPDPEIRRDASRSVSEGIRSEAGPMTLQKDGPMGLQTGTLPRPRSVAQTCPQVVR